MAKFLGSLRQLSVLLGRTTLVQVTRTPALRRLLAGGATTTLAVSFFGAAAPASDEKPKANPKPMNFDIVVRETDQLYDIYLIDNACAILRNFGSPDCSELLWRLARVLCEKGKLAKNPEERYAILLDYIGEIEGNKSRIAKSKAG